MIDLFEFGEYRKIENFSGEQLKGFKAYLEEVWKSRKRYSSEEEIDSSSDKDDKKHFLEFDGNKIRARGYVGFIQYEGVSVSIYPKICKEQPRENIVSQILYWLSYGDRKTHV